MNAEKVSVIAEKLIGKEYPKETIKKCWEDIMFNQFHDILGGCCIKDAYYDARNLHGRALQTTNEIVYFGLQSITNKIKMPGKNPDNAWNLVVWNLNGFEADTEIEAEVQWAWEFEWYNGGIVLEDEDGNEIECQIINELSVIPKFRSRFVFKAKIPPMGYKTFIVKQKGEGMSLKDTKNIENEKFKINYTNDGVLSVYDKTKCKTIVNEMFFPYVLFDECDTWGFNKTVYEPEKHYLKLKRMKITESGIIRTTLMLEWEYNNSIVTQYISLYENHIDCKYRVLWNEKKCALKFNLTNQKKMDCVVSTPYGSIKREKSEYEKPMGEWIKIYDAEQEINALSDSIFAYNFDGEAIGFTVLRNGIFGDLRTEPLDETKEYDYMGQGASEGTIRISFEENPDMQGILLNNPPLILCEANHDGVFESSDSFFESDPDVILTTLKKAEDNDQYVIRLYNTKEEKSKTNLRLFETKGQTVLNSHEIKTLKTEDNIFSDTNMLEE